MHWEIFDLGWYANLEFEEPERVLFIIQNFFIFSVVFLLQVWYTIFEVKINEFKRGRCI